MVAGRQRQGVVAAFLVLRVEEGGSELFEWVIDELCL